MVTPPTPSPTFSPMPTVGMQFGDANELAGHVVPGLVYIIESTVLFVLFVQRLREASVLSNMGRRVDPTIHIMSSRLELLVVGTIGAIACFVMLLVSGVTASAWGSDFFFGSVGGASESCCNKNSFHQTLSLALSLPFVSMLAEACRRLPRGTHVLALAVSMLVSGMLWFDWSSFDRIAKTEVQQWMLGRMSHFTLFSSACFALAAIKPAWKPAYAAGIVSIFCQGCWMVYLGNELYGLGRPPLWKVGLIESGEWGAPTPQPTPVHWKWAIEARRHQNFVEQGGKWMHVDVNRMANEEDGATFSGQMVFLVVLAFGACVSCILPRANPHLPVTFASPEVGAVDVKESNTLNELYEIRAL